MRLTITALLALFAFTPVAHAAPTDAQKCESAIELASAKYAQCRLNAESRDTKKPDPVKLEAALAKCSQKLSDAFAKATDKYTALVTRGEGVVAKMRSTDETVVDAEVPVAQPPVKDTGKDTAKPRARKAADKKADTDPTA